MHRQTFLVLLTVVVASVTAGQPGLADVVTLNDGSRVMGTVVRLGDGSLTLETKFAGTLEIDAALIESIAVDQSVNVAVDSGDRLVGSIDWQPQLDSALVRTELGDIPVKVDRINAIWPEGAPSPEDLAMEEQLAQARAEAEARAGKWSGNFELGISYTDGNSEDLDFRGGFTLKKKSTKDLLRFYARATYAESNKVRSESEVIGGAYYEYLFTDRFYWFGSTEAEYDEFENLDLRFTASTGPGYYWIKEEGHELKTHVGISYLHESYMSGVTRDDGQLDIGLDYLLDIEPWLQLTHQARYYPTFEELNDYRLTFDTAVLIPIASSENWKIKLGALYEYDPIPAPGLERLDQTYYGNLVFAFD